MLRFLSRCLFFVLHKLDRIAERTSAYNKQRYCRCGEGTRLYRASAVKNHQKDIDAIAMGAYCNVLGELVVLGHAGRIRIGDYCFVGEGARIWSAESVEIGSRVLISHGVNIHDNIAHPLSAAARHLQYREIFYGQGQPAAIEGIKSAPLVIEDDAWIGFNATILKGVRIGRGAVVGAGAVVTEDVPPFATVAGIPARRVGQSSE